MSFEMTHSDACVPIAWDRTVGRTRTGELVSVVLECPQCEQTRKQWKPERFYQPGGSAASCSCGYRQRIEVDEQLFSRLPVDWMTRHGNTIVKAK